MKEVLAKAESKMNKSVSVLTADYAASIGADRYCRDAAASARYAAEVFANA